MVKRGVKEVQILFSLVAALIVVNSFTMVYMIQTSTTGEVTNIPAQKQVTAENNLNSQIVSKLTTGKITVDNDPEETTAPSSTRRSSSSSNSNENDNDDDSSDNEDDSSNNNGNSDTNEQNNNNDSSANQNNENNNNEQNTQTVPPGNGEPAESVEGKDLEFNVGFGGFG